MCRAVDAFGVDGEEVDVPTTAFDSLPSGEIPEHRTEAVDVGVDNRDPLGVALQVVGYRLDPLPSRILINIDAGLGPGVLVGDRRRFLPRGRASTAVGIDPSDRHPCQPVVSVVRRLQLGRGRVRPWHQPSVRRVGAPGRSPTGRLVVQVGGGQAAGGALVDDGQPWKSRLRTGPSCTYLRKRRICSCDGGHHRIGVFIVPLEGNDDTAHVEPRCHLEGFPGNPGDQLPCPFAVGQQDLDIAGGGGDQFGGVCRDPRPSRPSADETFQRFFRPGDETRDQVGRADVLPSLVGVENEVLVAGCFKQHEIAVHAYISSPSGLTRHRGRHTTRRRRPVTMPPHTSPDGHRRGRQPHWRPMVRMLWMAGGSSSRRAAPSSTTATVARVRSAGRRGGRRRGRAR